MEKIWTILKKFVKEEDGLEMTEYAVVGGLVIAATAAIWTLLGTTIQGAINSLITAI